MVLLNIARMSECNPATCFAITQEGKVIYMCHMVEIFQIFCQMSDFKTFRNVALAISNSDENLFDNYNIIKPLLLRRHPIAKNRPLLFVILESLQEYQKHKTIIIPPPYPLIKSCDTKEVYQQFMINYKSALDAVDLSNPQTVIDLLKQIGLRGIRILAEMRHTTGSM